MNNTKRALIICAIVTCFLSAATNLFFLIRGVVLNWEVGFSSYEIFSIVYEALRMAALLVSAGLLIYSISNKGQLFNSRRSYYMAGVIICVCISLFSVPSILLVISLFQSDMVWVKPVDDVYFGEEKKEEKPEKELSDKERERKIANLRKLRDNGDITEEEFKEELLKLL